MKKILFVVDERKMGGVSILLEDIIKNINLNDKEIDILVLHNNGDRLKNIENKVNIIYGTKYFETVDIPLKEIIKHFNLKLLLKKLRLVFDMKTGIIKRRIIKERQIIISKQYDVEIAFKDGFTALFVGFGDCKKKIHWLHYDYKNSNCNEKYNRLFKKVLPVFDQIIAVSEGVKKDFNNVYHLENKCLVIPNYIDVKKIKPFSKKDNKKHSNNEIKIVSVGRLHHQKGYSRLIKALSQLSDEEKLNNVKCYIYGDGPERNNLQNLINLHSLQNTIFLKGATSNPYEKIMGSDLFVLPSIYEAFGIVIVEALTLKIPVLATQNPATSMLIDNNKTGLIVDNSLFGIYNGLKEILNNRELLTKWKKELNNYDYEKNNKEILNKLEDILK